MGRKKKRKIVNLLSFKGGFSTISKIVCNYSLFAWSYFYSFTLKVVITGMHVEWTTTWAFGRTSSTQTEPSLYYSPQPSLLNLISIINGTWPPRSVHCRWGSKIHTGLNTARVNNVRYEKLCISITKYLTLYLASHSRKERALWRVNIQGGYPEQDKYHEQRYKKNSQKVSGW